MTIVVVTMEFPDDVPNEAWACIQRALDGAHNGWLQAAEYFDPGSCEMSVAGLPEERYGWETRNGSERA